MRGDLSFTGDFECGNIGPVERVSLWEWVIMVRPDSHNERQRLWFDFKVSNTEAGQRVLFTLPNMSKGKSMYREGFTPLVRSLKRPTWQRMPSDQVLYYRVPKKRGYTLAFFFCFDDPRDTYEFAYSFPYTYSDLQRFLCRKDLAHRGSGGGSASTVDGSTNGYTSAQQPLGASPAPRPISGLVYRRELLCRTPLHRRVDLLTITSSTGTAEEEEAAVASKRIVLISARIHPGETPASFIMHGLVDFLTSRDPRAELLREHVLFKVVPMLNPDGVFLGNYRSNAFGYDLNRFWATPHPKLHPEVHATRSLLLRLNQPPPGSNVHGSSRGGGGAQGSGEHDSSITTTTTTSSSSRSSSSSSTPLNAFSSGAYVHDFASALGPMYSASSHSRRPSAANTSTRSAAAAASQEPPLPSSSSPSSSHTQPLRHLASNNEGTLDFFVDLHAHSAAASAFMYANAVEVPLPINAATEVLAAQADRDAAVHDAWHASVASLGKARNTSSSAPSDILTTTGGVAAASRPTAAAPPTSSSAGMYGNGGGFGLGSSTSTSGGEASHPNYPCHPTRSTRPGALPDPQLDVQRSLALWAWEAALPKALAQRSAAGSSGGGSGVGGGDGGGAFSLHCTRFDADPSKEGTGRRALGEALGSSVRCYTLETSFHGYEVNNRSPNAASANSKSPNFTTTGVTGAPLSSSNSFSSSSKGGRLAHFTPEKWMELGRDLALSFLDLYGLKTIPSTSPSSTTTPSTSSSYILSKAASTITTTTTTTMSRSAPTTPAMNATSGTSSATSRGPRRAIPAAALSATVPLYADAGQNVSGRHESSSLVGIGSKSNKQERASSADLSLSIGASQSKEGFSSSGSAASRQRSTLNPLVPGLPPSQAARTSRLSLQGVGSSSSSSKFTTATKALPLSVKVSGTSQSLESRNTSHSSGRAGGRKLL